MRREERRLRRIFQRALWVAVAAPIAAPLACGAPGTTVTSPDEEVERGAIEPGSGLEEGAGGAGNGEAAKGAAGGADRGEAQGAGGSIDQGTTLPSGEGERPSTEGASSGEPGTEVEGFANNASCAPVPFTPNPPDTCGKYVRLPCGLPAGVTPVANCYLWLNDCQKVCPGAYFNCHAVGDSCRDGVVVKDAKGGIDIDCATCSKGVGRIPAGLAPARMKRAPSALGTYFASASHLEAASVHAFVRLGRELSASEAPPSLLRAARRAARDEVRHARATARLARRFGGEPVRPRVASLPLRALDAVAIENAVEGCVRETFGALVAEFQAANARDPEIAREMEIIARDETRHAALSWAVARWAHDKLAIEAREAMAAHCREAMAALRAETQACMPEELRTQAGLPNEAEQRALLDVLEEQLWGTLA
ncbi:putative lipoprotein [Minicystis rosea]|nr:putative lipoprotein [Minicystis rosea]